MSNAAINLLVMMAYVRYHQAPSEERFDEMMLRDRAAGKGEWSGHCLSLHVIERKARLLAVQIIAGDYPTLKNVMVEEEQNEWPFSQPDACLMEDEY